MKENKPPTLLEALPNSVRELLKSREYTVKFEAGDQILRQDDNSRDVFFINYGKALVTFYTERGDRLSFTEMGAGQSFGELSAIDMQPRTANVVALENTSLTRIRHQQFQSLLRGNPDFADYILRQLVTLVRRLNTRIYELRALDSRHRIYAELLRLAKCGHPEGDRVIIDNPPTHTEIAARINSHREAVSRTCRALMREGLLEKPSKKLVLIRPEVLQIRIDQHLQKK